MSRATSPPLKIIVDVHERQSGIADTVRELGAEVEIAALPAGDYAVGADTLVERKRVLDLHAAVLKGRLWPQLGKLRAACAFPYRIVEGTDIDRGPLHHNAVRGACLAVMPNGRAYAHRMERCLPASDQMPRTGRYPSTAVPSSSTAR